MAALLSTIAGCSDSNENKVMKVEGTTSEQAVPYAKNIAEMEAERERSRRDKANR